MRVRLCWPMKIMLSLPGFGRVESVNMSGDEIVGLEVEGGKLRDDPSIVAFLGAIWWKIV